MPRGRLKEGMSIPSLDDDVFASDKKKALDNAERVIEIKLNSISAVSYTHLDVYKRQVLCGANTLHNNHPEIDALNVFPVPDGDTGTNTVSYTHLDVYKRQMQTQISLPFISAGAAGPLHLELTLTRAKFDELTRDLVLRTETHVRQALKDAGTVSYTHLDVYKRQF